MKLALPRVRFDDRMLSQVPGTLPTADTVTEGAESFSHALFYTPRRVGFVEADVQRIVPKEFE